MGTRDDANLIDAQVKMKQGDAANIDGPHTYVETCGVLHSHVIPCEVAHPQPVDTRVDRLAEWIRAEVMGGEYVKHNPWAGLDAEGRVRWQSRAMSAFRALDPGGDPVGVSSVEQGCTCGGVAACLQCQERDAAGGYDAVGAFGPGDHADGPQMPPT